MNPLYQEALASIIRWVLAIGAGFLVERGIWAEADAAGYVSAAALAVVALGWSFYQKYTMRTKLVTALALPATTEAKLETKIAAGESAPTSTAKSSQPVSTLTP